MPVSTGSFGEPRAKRCKHCDESSHRSESGSGYWQLQLDRDLVDTISSIYPEWFKSSMAEGGQSTTPRESPPKVVVDSSPLHNSLEQNKESLKVKLMLRRPVEQLVAQGIMPPLKTPAAFHGQRRQLERAKTGDLLKTKIQQRPSRLELESRHILEADPHVDPSLAEKQRMLKKARLADQLNDQLSHRPGPLELIQKNILHTEETIDNAVKAGHIPYRATCEGQLNRPQHPLSYINPEDDSQSSEDNNTVSTTSPGPPPIDVLEAAAKCAGIVVSLIPAHEGTVVVTTAAATPIIPHKDNSSEIIFPEICRPLIQSQVQSPASLVSSTSTLSPLSSIASPVPSIVSQPATPAPPPMPSITLTPRPIQSPVAPQIRTDAPGKDKNRKKSKSKITPKTRTIKFHEYKGPPSAQKTTITNTGLPGESSYELLLQQQTLLLQFQLQLQHKYPQIILPASQKQNNEAQAIQTNNNCLPPASPAPSTASDTPTTTTRLVGRLEDMKVSDLKAELKRRSLPVSGSKPQLIERLKPYTNGHLDMPPPSNSSVEDSHNSPQNTDVGSPQTQFSEDTDHMDIGDPMSPNPLLQHILDQTQQKTQEEIVREQQRQIEELQRELMLSQLKLQAATKAEPKAQLLALQKHLQARQHQEQMMLQMKQLQALQTRQKQTTTEEQQRIIQQQHVAFQNQKNLTGSLVLNRTDAAIVLNHLVQGKTKLINGHARAHSIVVRPVVSNSPVIKTEIKTEFIIEEKAPPPLYEEATKQIKLYEEVTKQIKKEKSHIKSQIVDDVLEILIKNGELPASAAQDPQTPNSAGVRVVEIAPVFPQEVLHNGDNTMPRHNGELIRNLEIIHNASELETNTEPALELDTSDILDTLDTLENMDFSQLMELGTNNQNNNNEQDSVPMDTDDWLESLLPSSNDDESNHNCSVTSSASVIGGMHDSGDLGGYGDPLMGIAQDPFDPFCLEDFRSASDLTAALSWDKVDYAA